MAACPPSRCPTTQADAIAAYVMTLKQPAGDATAGTAARATPRPASDSLPERGTARTATWCAAAAECSGPTSPTSDATAGPTQIEQALRDPGAAPAAPAGRGGRGGRGAAPVLSGGDRASARRPDTAGHREEREHLRPATAGRRWQAASAVEGPGRGDRARKIADAEGGGHARRRCATWSPTSAAFRPTRMPRRCSRPANWDRVFRSPTWRSPSPAPGRLITAT